MADQSAEGEEKSVKRQKLSWGKLCAVSQYYFYNDNQRGFEGLIGFLDLDSSLDGKGFANQTRIPDDIIRSQCSAFWAFGSTLYVFQGWDLPLRNRPNIDGKSVYSIDLQSLAERGDETLDRKMLQETCPLEHPKFFPLAIEAPANKIMVFSQFFSVNSEKGRFEIYDPQGGPSTVLPEVPTRVREKTIRSYGFIRESQFIIQFDDDMLMFDLESSAQDWQFKSSNVVEAMVGHFVSFENRYCFTPYAAYDLGHVFGAGNAHDYPWQNYAALGNICPIGDGYDKENEICNFWIYKMGVTSWEEDYGRVTINLCCSDLKEYKKDREEKDAKDKVAAAARKYEQVSADSINTKVIKTIEFQVDTPKYPAMAPVHVVIF